MLVRPEIVDAVELIPERSTTIIMAPSLVDLDEMTDPVSEIVDSLEIEPDVVRRNDIVPVVVDAEEI